MMSKKDYDAIAAAINMEMSASSGHPGLQYPIVQVADRIALHCAATNPEFDRARFLKACGVNPTCTNSAPKGGYK